MFIVYEYALKEGKEVKLKALTYKTFKEEALEYVKNYKGINLVKIRQQVCRCNYCGNFAISKICWHCKSRDIYPILGETLEY